MEALEKEGAENLYSNRYMHSQSVSQSDPFMLSNASVSLIVRKPLVKVGSSKHIGILIMHDLRNLPIITGFGKIWHLVRLSRCSMILLFAAVGPQGSYHSTWQLWQAAAPARWKPEAGTWKP